MESRVGPYRLLRKIGRGGMGSVYEAVHETIERRVAIKILDAESARQNDLANRFLNEARAVNRVNDPGLVQMFDHGMLPDGTAYIVMEYLDGETLARRLRRLRRRLPVPELLRLLRQTAETLAATHRKGITHRDLKPDNIMVVRDTAVPGGERTKILDFGIAKLRESSPVKATNTHKDLLMGTPGYMSPEQCRGAGGVDEKTDVYSLGVVLYRALAGRLPFLAGGAGDIMAQHIYQPVPLLSELAPWLPSSLTELVHRLLSKEKQQRPSMEEVATELARLASELADFQLPEISDDPSLPGCTDRVPVAGAGENAEPGADEDEEDDEGEDHVVETMSLSETPSAREPVLLDPLAISSSARHYGSSPSQLGWSIANTNRQRGWRGRVSGIAVIAAAGVMLAGAWILLAGRSHGPAVVRAVVGKGSAPAAAPAAEVAPPPPSSSAPPAAAPAPGAGKRATVEWILETTPPGAEILRVADGQVLGRTPWHGEVQSGSGSDELRISLPGHVERLLSLDRSTDAHRRFQLQPIAAPPPSTKAVGATPAAKSRVKNRKRGQVKIEFED